MEGKVVWFGGRWKGLRGPEVRYGQNRGRGQVRSEEGKRSGQVRTGEEVRSGGVGGADWSLAENGRIRETEAGKCSGGEFSWELTETCKGVHC